MDAVSALIEAVKQIDARLRAHINTEKKLAAWTAPSFGAGWSNVGGAYAVCGYWRDQTNVVHLRGRVTGGAFPSTIFTLPVNYRPSATLSFSTLTGAILEISTAGVVATVSGASPVSLDGISFRAEV